MDLVWSDRYLSNTLCYGLEGKNYTITAGKGTDNPTVAAKTGAEQTWAIWHNWLGPLWDQWDSNWNSAQSLLDMQERNRNATVSKVCGFVFDSTNVKDELAQVSALSGEISPILSTGSMPDFDNL